MSTSKNKILVWAVVLLIAANITVLATIWIMHHKQKVQKGSPADYLVKELALNDEQQKKLHALANEHHQQSEKIKEEIKDARHELFKQLQQPTINDSAKKAAGDTIAKYLEQLDLLTFDHFQQVRAICTPQQQKKFDEIIEDVLLMIATGPPPGEHGPHDDGRMPPPDDHMPPPEH